jgi:hypothetical protein
MRKKDRAKKRMLDFLLGPLFYRTILPLSYHETGQLLNGQNRSFLPEFGVQLKQYRYSFKLQFFPAARNSSKVELTHLSTVINHP